MATTPYDLAFRVDREDEVLCETTLSEADILKFQKAVQDDYYFQVSVIAQRGICSCCQQTIQSVCENCITCSFDTSSSSRSIMAIT